MQNPSHRIGLFKYYVNPYIFFLVRKSWLDASQAEKRQNSTTMNQQETPSEWLARKKAGLGWLQGQHRVPGTSTNSLGGSGDKAAGNSKQQQAGDKEKVINEIISISFDKGCSSEFVKFTNIPLKIQLSSR